MSIIFGISARTPRPVESVRYLPTFPVLFPIPCGKREDFEFSRMRADSHALAASTTMRARTWFSRLVFLSIYETPVAVPVSSVVTSRAIACGMIFRRSVSRAGPISTVGDEKFECVAHPRLHWPQ
jgi:hypothetical protein